MTSRGMMMLLIALSTATFFVTSAGASNAPFLNLITRDLATTLPAVAHLFSIQALAWGIASLVAGMVSARFGQRAILVGGILLIGNIVGGRIADRTRSRARVFAIGSALTAVVALPLLAWHPGLGVSVALGFVFSFVNAAGRPSLLATLAEVPAELRSALFGLNVTMASMGWLLAGSVGGWLIATSGFAGLGAFSALVAALGCGLALFSSRDRTEGRGTRAEQNRDTKKF